MVHGPSRDASGDGWIGTAKEEGALLLRSGAALWRRIAAGGLAQQPLRTGSQDDLGAIAAGKDSDSY